MNLLFNFNSALWYHHHHVVMYAQLHKSWTVLPVADALQSDALPDANPTLSSILDNSIDRSQFNLDEASIVV